MIPGSQADGSNGTQAIDPISRHILQRTVTSHKIPQTSHNAPISIIPVLSREEDPDLRSPEPDSLRRTDTGLSKKKGVSFLSRIMGGKKKDDSVDVRDSVSEICEDRSGGNDAEVFSHPVGFIPKFPAPPRYIRVKAQNRKKRDLDRLFLSQILLDPLPLSRRRSSNEIDSKIVNIGDTPTIPPPNSSRKLNNATWAAEFSKDGKYFAAAGQDKKLRIWEVISDKEFRDGDDQSQSGSEGEQTVKLDAPVFKHKLIREYDGHTAAILDLSWSKNNFILTSSMDKSVRLYHVSREECLCSFKHNDFVTSIQFHPRDDRFFLAGSLDSKLRLWSIPDKSVAYWTQVPDMITAVAFTPDGKTAIAGCLSGLCIIYNTEGLKAHSQIHVRSSRGRNTKGSKITGIDTIALPHENGPADVKLLITSNDSRIRMYNLKDKTLEMKFRGNENSCSQIRASFSDDGMFVICGSEDRKVYVWPTGPVEKADIEKRPVEIFEAHSQIVTTAIFAPTATRRLLAQSGDPIYDLCNPPPVVLLSRNGSLLSSGTNTHQSGSEEHQKRSPSNEKDSPSKPVESPAYLARHSHIGGQIIVTADYSGQIKVFRQDCAYQKRRDASWETGSVLSRKMTKLSRSGSVTKRDSRRSSLNLPSKTNPSNDRILNWRNSIASTPSASNSLTDFGFKRSNTERERSSSPRKSISKRFSLTHNSTPLSNIVSPPSSPNKARQPSGTPGITLQSPDSNHSHPVQNSRAAGEEVPPSPSTNQSTPFEQRIQATPDNPLSLIGDHSYRAWDVRYTLAPMIKQAARSPNENKDGQNPISRSQSIVSQLSSDAGNSQLSGEDRTPGTLDRKLSTGTTGAGGSTDDEELKCTNCGGEKFKMIKVNGGGRGLKCRNCGSVIP